AVELVRSQFAQVAEAKFEVAGYGAGRGRVDHLSGAVHAEHPCLRPALGQKLRRVARAAAEIDHGSGRGLAVRTNPREQIAEGLSAVPLETEVPLWVPGGVLRRRRGGHGYRSSQFILTSRYSDRALSR